MRTLRVGWLFLLCVVAIFSACSTHTLRNEALWYQVTVPKSWQPDDNAVIRSKQGDSLSITRVRDDSPLESVVESRRKAFQIEMAGFVIESESWIKVNGHKGWKLVGTLRTKDEEIVHVKVIIAAKEYKYFLEFRTPSETYRKRRPIIQAIIRSFTFKIPEY